MYFSFLVPGKHFFHSSQYDEEYELVKPKPNFESACCKATSGEPFVLGAANIEQALNWICNVNKVFKDQGYNPEIPPKKVRCSSRFLSRHSSSLFSLPPHALVLNLPSLCYLRVWLSIQVTELKHAIALTKLSMPMH
jgi:hypothetical protein